MSAAIDQERMMKAGEKMRKRMMPGSAGSCSSSGAPPKYRMVYTPPEGSCIDHISSRIGAITHNSNRDNSSSNSHSSSNSNSSIMPLLHRHNKLPSDHHNSFPLATFHALTVGRWATLLENAACPSKATRRGLRYLLSISRGAIRRVLHHRQVVPTTPPWRRFPWEKKC
jgi:hypothetical protein